ncbi:MAG: LacI family DNA-binding transcriptional regulator [Synergistaceae bacterium]|nr:LacI family DNA-binding transcriptional regulator [Synergistaceae bacterium]
MVTIRDVARLAGVSVATVSIVMNNKSKERSIPESTQERIKNAMRELGYQPNVSARRLRSKYKQSPVIAFFWPKNLRFSMFTSFVDAFLSAIHNAKLDFELVIQTYERGKLEEFDEQLTKRGYNGVIIGGCTEDDIKHLEKMSLLMPVVLINRESEKFSTVGINDDLVGKIAAREFVRKGIRSAGVFAVPNGHIGSNARVAAFFKYCKYYGINVDFDSVLRSESTFDGGYYIAGNFCEIKNRPHAVFCDSDSIAIGAVKAFHDMNINVPKDIEILTVDLSISGFSAYFSPSLSVIELPNDEIAKRVINILHKKISSGSQSLEHVKIEPRLILRESFA